MAPQTTPAPLSNTKALVTGATRGIGRAIVLALSDAGASVALVGRHPGSLARVASACQERGGKVVPLRADLSVAGQPEAVVKGAIEGLGGLNVLVNNAGMYAHGAADSADVATWDAVIDLNVRALVHVTRAALPALEREPRSAVINIASISAKFAHAGGAIYCASKHAVLGFSNAVFEDVRERNIKVCAICPGYVNTDMAADAGIDLSKALQPADIAQAVLYVLACSDTCCPTELVLRPQRSPNKS